MAPEGFGKLAALVGDLPLALEEAAAYLEQTGIGLAEGRRSQTKTVDVAHEHD
jgi:hypothetical protein